MKKTLISALLTIAMLIAMCETAFAATDQTAMITNVISGSSRTLIVSIDGKTVSTSSGSVKSNMTRSVRGVTIASIGDDGSVIATFAGQAVTIGPNQTVTINAAQTTPAAPATPPASTGTPPTGGTTQPVTAPASEGRVIVKIDGKTVNFEESAFMSNGRVMVPMREIFEALGATVGWNDSTKTIISVKNDTTVVMNINSTAMVINGKEITPPLDVPPVIANGKTFVPVRATSEAFGSSVAWDAESQTINISTKGQSQVATPMPSPAPEGNINPAANESDFTFTESNGNLTITGYTGPTNAGLKIPASIDGKKVVAIGDRAFASRTDIIGPLTIPDSVTTIEEAAFNSCTGLTGSPFIPDSVTSIGNISFYGCTGFTGSVIIGNSVTTIGFSAFANCSNLTGGLVLGNSLTTIGSSAFSNCTELTGALKIPDSVTTIGGSAFYECRGFTNLTIGNSVESIGVFAFDGCHGFSTVTIPKSVTSIEYGAFSNCAHLKNIIFLGDAPTFGDNVFGSWNHKTRTIHYTAGASGWPIKGGNSGIDLSTQMPRP